MRIITGSAKGRVLATLPGEDTRPTAERTKEAIFSMLQFELEGRKILDLFSGSGQMGLEALSRGAASAVLVDRSRDAVAIIQKNAIATRLNDRCRILCVDGVEYLKRETGAGFDIVFLDPPYATDLIKTSLEILLAKSLLKQGSLVVCESSKEDVFEGDDALASRFDIVKKSRYGIAWVTILTPAEAERSDA